MKRGKLQAAQSSFSSLIQHGDWAMISQGVPQKMFIWDKQGNYNDCVFPNPIYGHFLGGEKVKGKNVRDVLEPQAVTQLLEAMKQTTRSRKPVQVNLVLFGSPSSYQTIVCLFPFSNQIMGWVNDYPIAETPCAPADMRPRTPARSRKYNNTSITCSAREREVCVLLCKGKSNAEMAHQLQVSERTVRFHLENLFRKCQVSSRFQLAQCAPSLLLLNKVSTTVSKVVALK